MSLPPPASGSTCLVTERGKRVVVLARLHAAGALAGQHAPRGLLLKALGWLTPAGR